MSVHIIYCSGAESAKIARYISLIIFAEVATSIVVWLNSYPFVCCVIVCVDDGREGKLGIELIYMIDS